MIQVDEVFPVDIRASIGPAGTIKRLFQNRDFFRIRGYKMTIFANHFTHARGLQNFFELREMKELPKQGNYAQAAGGGKRKRWQSRIKQWAHDTKLFGYIFLRYKEQKGMAKMTQMYIDMGRRPDIIVFHGYGECDYYLKHRQVGDSAKVICFLHSDGRDITMTYNNYPKLVGTKLMRQLYENYMNAISHADRIVYISKLAVEAFMELHPDYDRSKIYTAVNGIDDKTILNVEPSCNYKYRLCTSGTVNHRKGQYVIVEAMKRMDKDILAQTHLTIMGVGPDFDTLLSEVQKSGLQEHVKFLGNVPNPEMHAKLCAENIYCLISNNEGLPIAILEAMRAGLPVISTKVAGIPEQVDERNGILIDQDISQLTEVLNDLPNYDWEKMGKASRMRYETEFKFERMLDDYANVFDSLK